MGKILTECELLERISKVLGPKGENWTKGVYKEAKAEGKGFDFCLLGAFQQVTGFTHDYNIHERFATRMPVTMRILDRTYHYENPVEFNDDDATSWRRMNNLLKKAHKEACDEDE